MGPHIRTGYLIVPPRLIAGFTRIANRFGSVPDPFVLGAVAGFIDENQYLLHVKSLRSIYAERLSMLSTACRAKISNATLLEPVGGLCLALRFSDKFDERTLCRAAAAINLAVAPLSEFYCDEPAPFGLVLGSGALPDRLIDTTINRLADMIADVRKGRSAAD